MMPGDQGVGRDFSGRILRELIHSGRVADVYRADDSQLKCSVIVKVYATDSGRSVPVEMERELEALRAVRHARLAHLIDAALEPLPHLVLGDASTRSPSAGDAVVAEEEAEARSEQTLLAAASAVAEGIKALHEAGFVHGDVKPENVVGADRGAEAVLVDLGSAVPFGVEVERGTPRFLPPEVLTAIQPEATATLDIYGLGMTLHEWWTGERLFDATDDSAMLRAKRDPVRVVVGRRGSSMRRDFGSVLNAMLARDPDQRYSTMADVLADLRRIQAGRMPTIRRPSFAL